MSELSINAMFDERDRQASLCSQCGELPSVMIKIGTADGWCTDCLDEAAETTERVAAMLAEARAEVAQDVRAIPAPGPFDYLADWAQYRSLVLQAVARHMPSAVREGGTERSGGVQRPDGPQESAGPSDGRTGPQTDHGPCPFTGICREACGDGDCYLARPDPTCGEALGDMRCQLRRGHAGDHEDYSAVAQERRA